MIPVGSERKGPVLAPFLYVLTSGVDRVIWACLMLHIFTNVIWNTVFAALFADNEKAPRVYPGAPDINQPYEWRVAR